MIPYQLAGSGLPSSKEEVEWATRQGVGGILSLTESPLPQEWIRDQSLEYRHLPIEDFGGPTVRQMTEAVEFIKRNVENGKSILVHCYAGQGRTGTILAAYLVYFRNLSSSEAIRWVREVRPGSVQNQVQEDSVNRFAEYLKKKAK